MQFTGYRLSFCDVTSMLCDTLGERGQHNNPHIQNKTRIVQYFCVSNIDAIFYRKEVVVFRFTYLMRFYALSHHIGENVSNLRLPGAALLFVP